MARSVNILSIGIPEIWSWKNSKDLLQPPVSANGHHLAIITSVVARADADIGATMIVQEQNLIVDACTYGLFS